MPRTSPVRVRAQHPAKPPLAPDMHAVPAHVVNIGVASDVIGIRLRQIYLRIQQASACVLAERNLRPGEFSTLAIVAASPGVSQINLAREIGIDKAAVVALLDSLESRGWAVRRQSPADRRRHALFITPAGKKAMTEIHALLKEREALALANLSPAERENFGAVLEKIHARCFRAT